MDDSNNETGKDANADMLPCEEQEIVNFHPRFLFRGRRRQHGHEPEIKSLVDFLVAEVSIVQQIDGRYKTVASLPLGGADAPCS